MFAGCGKLTGVFGEVNADFGVGLGDEVEKLGVLSQHVAGTEICETYNSLLGLQAAENAFIYQGMFGTAESLSQPIAHL